MSISDDLFLAILAMDSYNRGYNAGLGDPQTGLAGTQIGNATLAQRSDTSQGSTAVAASFFAQAYTWNGQTVISYRAATPLSRAPIPSASRSAALRLPHP